jgi:cytochrome c oxidase assembly protein subunit 15
MDVLDQKLDESRDKIIGYWILAICAMVFVMVVLGGLTRLTHSGLSMVEWQPLSGWIPPLTDSAWQEFFQKYQATPEYLKLNVGMTVDEFKSIFWLEYFHRLWGRLIGLVVLIPLIFFAIKRWLYPKLILQLFGLFCLGGLQGLMGWYMVQSGMVDQPDVSPYRLTAHLGLALLIYGIGLWLAFEILQPSYEEPRELNSRGGTTTLLVFIVMTILSGGFVAGNDAGLTYNTFPFMDGRIIPTGALELSPFYLNFFENIATVQFNHRLLAVSTLCMVLLFWVFRRSYMVTARSRSILDGLAAAVLIQVILGVLTLLFAVPVGLAITHQATALVVFSLALWLVHDGRPRKGFGSARA